MAPNKTQPGAPLLKRKQGDRVLVFVLSLVGASFAFYAVLAVFTGPHALVQCGVTTWSQPGSGRNATLLVVFFDSFGYTRSAPDPQAFDMEIAFWYWAPATLMVLGGAGLGWILGLLLGRWWRASLAARGKASQ
jgi:hypothetical protein